MAVEEDEIGQMKVAVTLADSPGGDPRFEGGFVAGQFPLEPLLDRVGTAAGVRPVAADFVEIHPEHLTKSLGAAVATLRRGDGLPGLDRGDRLPELPARCRIDPAGVEAGIEPIGLVELDKLHRPLDRLASAVNMGRLGGAGDRHRFQVEPRREAPVQADLLGAEILAPVERGEVEKLELARLLHLVGEGPGEEHIRDVRLDELDRADRMGIGRRFEKFFNPGRSRCHCRHPNTSRWRGRGRGAARSSSMSLPPRCQSAAP